ncbi:MAG: class I SAM-dependent methyltransferase [Thermodesulfobacteriota bacterium]
MDMTPDIPKKKATGLKKESITKIYGGQSKVYDALFKKIFYPRIKHAIASMNIRPGDRVLDVGVGTGLSLSFFPRHCSVTGIDLSSKMLTQAKKKVEQMGLDHIRLIEMDAMHLDFPDDTFDKIFISHVVSVVPDPYKMMDEVRRVCKKGGRVIVINHFRSRNKMVAKVENMITPLSKKVGWRSDLDIDEFMNNSGLTIEREYKLKKLDFWHVIFATNSK